MKYLTSADVWSLVSLDDVIEFVETGYRLYGEGSIVDLPRSNAALPGGGGSLKSLPATEPESLGGAFYTGFPGRERYSPWLLTVVFEPEYGLLRAVIEGDRLSWLRTGATSAVATDYCARADASTLGIIGSGRQARSQLLAVSAVRPISDVRVYSPTEAHRETFVEEMSESVDATVSAVGSALDAVDSADVVCTATTASEPVLKGDWLREGTHINAIGAHYPDQREVDGRTVERSRVVVDTRDRAQKEEGELLLAAEEERFEWDEAVEMGDIVTGAATGRTSDDEITYMTSGGLGFEYLITGRFITEQAEAEGYGTDLRVTPDHDLTTGGRRAGSK